LPIRLGTTSRTVARPFASMLFFRETSGFALPSVATSI
jgi:hypothetical protein